MLARVDVLDRHLDAGVGVAHRVLGGRAVQTAAVGVAAPRLVDRREVVVVAPVARVEQLQEPGPVGPGLGAEDARGGAPPRRVGADLRGEPLGVGAGVRGDVVVLVGLLERGDRGDRVVEQPHEVREGVAEEAGDAHGHVDARTAELGEGHDLDARHAL